VRPLRDWPGRRVLAIALAWVLGLPLLAAPAVFGAVAWLARTERERAAPAIPDSVAPGLRITYLPPEPGDFLMSAAGPGVLLLLGVLLVPPLALCVAWIVAQRRRSGKRT
jgi:predicted outer membrane lipoprotein